MLVPKYCLNDINDSVFAKEMIRQMLHKDPSQRPTLHEIQNAPFFWTDKQKQDHVKFILRGPKVDAIEKKVYFLTTFYGFSELKTLFLYLAFTAANSKCWTLW